MLEALVRVPLIYPLLIDVVVAVSEAMTIAVFAGLIAWTLRYIRHTTRAASPDRTLAARSAPTKRRHSRRERSLAAAIRRSGCGHRIGRRCGDRCTDRGLMRYRGAGTLDSGSVRR